VKVGQAIRQLHELETDLADEFRKVGERHAADHEVFHACHVLATQCEQHAIRLHLVADRYATELPDDEDRDLWQGLLEATRDKMSKALGRMKPSALLLLRDLRQLFLAAEECSITWVMLGQAAQAARDKELLQVVRDCHTETEVQVKWLTTQIKVRSPQVLVGG